MLIRYRQSIAPRGIVAAKIRPTRIKDDSEVQKRMKTRRMSTRQRDHLAKITFAVLTCGVVPFIFYGEWGKILAKAYLLTFLIIFLVLYVYWKSIRDWWFWRAVLVVLLLHSAIVVALVVLNLNFPGIDHLPRMAYQGVSILFVVEGRAALWIVARSQASSGHVAGRATSPL